MARVLRLAAADLLSKWGFNDGDCPDDLIDWCEARGLDIDPLMPSANRWHRILARLVREQLVPELDQSVELVDVDTIHNPIRATEVDGIDVESCWYEPGRPRPVLSPAAVEVPFELVMRVAREVYGTEAVESLS